MPSTTPETRNITSEELQVFTRQMGVLMATGVELLRALEVATGQVKNPRLDAVARGIRNLMTDGREFYEALTVYPDVFSPFYVQMARQGEEEGILGPALLSIADYMSREGGPSPAAPVAGLPLPAISAGPAFPWGRLAALPLLGLSASLLGLAGVWVLGLVRLLPVEMMMPVAFGWIGLCLGTAGLAAARLGQPAKRREKAGTTAGAGPTCSFCGRPEAQVGSLHRGEGGTVCDSCVRSRVGQLKPADHPERAYDPRMAVAEEAEPATRFSLSDPAANGVPPEEPAA